MDIFTANNFSDYYGQQFIVFWKSQNGLKAPDHTKVKCMVCSGQRLVLAHGGRNQICFDEELVVYAASSRWLGCLRPEISWSLGKLW